MFCCKQTRAHLHMATCLAALTWMLLPAQHAMAADCQVNSTTSVTNGNAGCILDGGDSLEITATGSISTTGAAANGVLAQGAGNTITNSGNIHTLGDGAIGISMETGSGNNTVLGEGGITTQGAASFGIYTLTESGSNSITAGDISTQGGYGHGIYAIGVNGGNTITVNTVSTSGTNANGIDASSSNGSHITAGSIHTSNQAATGISLNDDHGSSTITVGDIHTLGDNSFGININSGHGNATITADEITTSGFNSAGIRALTEGGVSVTVNRITTAQTGGIYVITQNGNNSVDAVEITSTGDGGEPVHLYTQNGNNTLTVDKVSSQGNSAFLALQTDSGSNTVNIGDVTTTGEGAFALRVMSNDGSNTVNFNGNILTYGEDADGIYAFSGTGANIVSVSGRIVTAQGRAIVFRDSAENSLSLFAPSYIGGAFDFGGHIEHLNITTSASNSVLWDFSDDPTAVPNVTGKVPYFFSSTGQFAVMDPSGFAAMPNLMSDLAGTIANSVAGHNQESATGTPFWVEVAGGQKTYDGETDATLSQTVTTGASIFGMDILRKPLATFGIMAGFDKSDVSVDSPYSYSYSNGAQGMFLGLYGTRAYGWTLLSGSLAAGWLTHDDNRFVNDNMIDNNAQRLGKDEATSSYSSTWLSPSLGITAPMVGPADITFTPDMRLLYARQDVDGYTEEGSNANATVAAHTIETGEIRAGFGLSKPIGNMLFSTRAGYSYRKNLGEDSVQVTMMDETADVPFFYTDAGAAFVGVGVDAALGEQARLRLRTDAVRGDGVEGISASGGLVFNF